jgi:hypothetical protein
VSSLLRLGEWEKNNKKGIGEESKEKFKEINSKREHERSEPDV